MVAKGSGGHGASISELTPNKGYAFQPLLIANYSLLIAYVSNKINQGVYI